MSVADLARALPFLEGAGAFLNHEKENAMPKAVAIPADQHRPIYEIANEIRRLWPKVYFGAEPYLDAMASLDKITDNYGADSAKEILVYFVANTGTWRGDDARRIKAELRGMYA